MTSFRKKIANFFYGIGGAFESAIVSVDLFTDSKGSIRTCGP